MSDLVSWDSLLYNEKVITQVLKIIAEKKTLFVTRENRKDIDNWKERQIIFMDFLWENLSYIKNNCSDFV